MSWAYDHVADSNTLPLINLHPVWLLRPSLRYKMSVCTFCFKLCLSHDGTSSIPRQLIDAGSISITDGLEALSKQ